MPSTGYSGCGALRRILPDIATFEVQNDSVVRLNGRTPAEGIILVKAKEPVKAAE